MKAAIATIGFPCVVKPVMSSSGKGQSVLKSDADVEPAWDYALAGGRVNHGRVIVEGFIDFEYEITLLTVRAHDPASGVIANVFLRADRPCAGRGRLRRIVAAAADVRGRARKLARRRARRSRRRSAAAASSASNCSCAATTSGSRKSARVRTTPASSRSRTQRFSEFDLHARAILGLPVDTSLRAPGASAVIYGGLDEAGIAFEGVADALAVPDSDLRLFGKPESFMKRRMGVALATGRDIGEARERAKLAASKVRPVSTK